jgi:hypothetical protein
MPRLGDSTRPESANMHPCMPRAIFLNISNTLYLSVVGKRASNNVWLQKGTINMDGANLCRDFLWHEQHPSALLDLEALVAEIPLALEAPVIKAPNPMT